MLEGTDRSEWTCSTRAKGAWSADVSWLRRSRSNLRDLAAASGKNWTLLFLHLMFSIWKFGSYQIKLLAASVSQLRECIWLQYQSANTFLLLYVNSIGKLFWCWSRSGRKIKCLYEALKHCTEGIKWNSCFHFTLWLFSRLRCAPRRMWFGSRRNWCWGNWRRGESFRQISSPDPGSAPPSPDPVDPVQTADLHSNHNQEICHRTSGKRSAKI